MLTRRSTLGASAAIALASIGIAGPAAAQPEANWPSKPIRWIVPTPLGGPLDATARNVAQATAARLGQPILVENRPGASSSIGADAVAKAPADGHTFLFSQGDSLINVVSMYRQLPYDPRRDFALLTQVAQTGAVLMTHPDIPANSLTELIALAKSRKEPLSYGSWGPGSYTHVLGETLAKRAGIRLLHVPYKGGGPAIQDLVGKQISLAFGPPSVAAQFQAQGRVKVLAISGEKRSANLPSLPTFAESGLNDAIFKFPIWFGLSAPAHTSKPILEKMHQAVLEALQAPTVAKFIKDSGFEVVGSSMEQFQRAYDQEFVLVNQMIKDAGVVPE